MCTCGHIDHFHDGLGCIACGCLQIPDSPKQEN